MSSTVIVPLAGENRSLAAAALARAFHDDPLQSYIFPDSEERAARSPAHFSALLEYGLKYGEVFSTPEATHGAAVWLGPDAWDVSEEKAAASGLDRLPSILGEEAAARFSGVLNAAEPLHRTAVPPKHWYVMVIGVCPTEQGKGIGRKLLQPMIDRAESEGLPVYLETAQPGNIAFYEQLGFRVIGEIDEPKSGLRLWAFRRDPAST